MFKLKVQFSKRQALQNLILMRPVYITRDGVYSGDRPEIPEAHPIRSILLPLLGQCYAMLTQKDANIFSISDRIRESFAGSQHEHQVSDFLSGISSCEELSEQLFPEPSQTFVGISLPSQANQQPLIKVGMIQLNTQVSGVCDLCLFYNEWEDFTLGGALYWPPNGKTKIGIVLDIINTPTELTMGRIRIYLSAHLS